MGRVEVQHFSARFGGQSCRGPMMSNLVVAVIRSAPYNDVWGRCRVRYELKNTVARKPMEVEFDVLIFHNGAGGP